MSYQVLALKYRPQSFDEVVGQPHVTTTLANAITASRVAHAILFTGPRGTGKTTIARIMAKAMNCKNGPLPTPCNTCKTCRDIIEGHCSDVFEIDGASNNSVEQIRDLRENVTYMPASSPFKIYIIDEVHMLSTAAFNALLKTLEEPPDHVLFIFATTEVHKIPATILSRCQRHDLARISLEDICAHLGLLCEKEGFSIDQKSLELIALEADGSIRDSLSLLDRILAASPDKDISHARVIESLGVTDRKIMFDITTAIFQKDGAALVSMVEAVSDAGLDLKKFYADLILHFRNLNVIKLCGPNTPALNLADGEKTKLMGLVSEPPAAYLGTLLEQMLTEESLVKFASHTKTAVEIVLLKMIQINQGADLDHIIGKLDSLAKKIDSRLPHQEQINKGQVPHNHGQRDFNSSGPEKIKSVTRGPASKKTEDHLSSRMSGKEEGHSLTGEALRKNEAARKKAPPCPPGQAVSRTERSEQEGPSDTWQDFLQRIEKKLPFIFALLSKNRVDLSHGDKIRVELQNCSSFEKTRLKTKQTQLQALCKEHLGKSLEIKVLSEQNTNSTSAPGKAETQAQQAAAMNHPMVLDAQRIFNGEIINY